MAAGAERLAFDSHILDFFIDRLYYDNNTFQFSYHGNENDRAIEYWSPSTHIVPLTSGIWLVHDGIHAQVRHLFLSNSAADLLCFCQQRQQWLGVSGSVAFAAMGLRPSVSQISFLMASFVNAKLHTLFDADLVGRITDCKIALWYAGKVATFKVVDEDVEICYRNSKLHLHSQGFSLNQFEKITGFRSGIRTHKPKSNFTSFSELFMRSSNFSSTQ